MKISHFGIAVRDLKSAEQLFAKLLGVSDTHHEEVADQKVRIASFELGDARIELTEPTSADSPISKFLEKRGEGIHHVAFEVEDVAKELARLKAQGFQLIDETPRPGSHNTLIAFLHPRSTNGVLVELCQQNPLLKKEGAGGGVSGAEGPPPNPLLLEEGE
jgi:methylmalonyl-CoA/ethylmalonyl-CoA epimerase